MGSAGLFDVRKGDLIMRLFIYAICVLTLFSSCFAETPSSDPAHVDEAIGVAFPPVLATLRFEDVTIHSEPGKGYTLVYGIKAVQCEIDVFDNGISGIPTGYDSTAVADVIAAYKKSFEEKETKGEIANVRHRYEKVLPAEGKIRFQWVKTEFNFVGESVYQGPMVTETYVTGFKGKLIKAVINYKKQNIKGGGPVSRRLHLELAQILETALK